MQKRFFIAAPIVALFAFGVLTKTTQKLTPVIACSTSTYTGLPTIDQIGMFEGVKVLSPQPLASMDAATTNVLGVASPNERWIEIDLSDQMLYAWDGGELFLSTKISSGLPSTPTPTGEFRVWIKLRAAKMEGGEGSYYYNLPNVPYVMYFENQHIPGWRGYGIHGTYWHNDFGTPRSHGCVNTPTPVAEKLYHWATPILDEGKYTAYSSADNPGIRVIIHE